MTISWPTSPLNVKMFSSVNKEQGRGLRADLLADLAADRLFGAFAKLDPASERTIERLPFNGVVSLADEDSVVVPKDANGKRADLTHGDPFFISSTALSEGYSRSRRTGHMSEICSMDLPFDFAPSTCTRSLRSGQWDDWGSGLVVIKNLAKASDLRKWFTTKSTRAGVPASPAWTTAPPTSL